MKNYNENSEKNKEMSENLCRNKLFEILKEDKSFGEKLNEELKNNNISRMYIGKEISVPYRHMYRLDNGCLNLEISCFSQDIIFFDFVVIGQKKICDKISIELESDKGFKNKIKCICKSNYINGKDEEETIKNNDKFLIFPYVTIETKIGGKNKPTTDSVLVASKKVEFIKSVFPHCKSILLIFVPKNSKLTKKVYRCGKPFFDDILELRFNNENNEIKFDNKDISQIKDEIKNLINKSVEELNKLNE